MKIQVEAVEKLHRRDLADGFGEVYVPNALGRKYAGAATSLGRQYVFPSKKRARDPRSGKTRGHHVLESGLQKAVKGALVYTHVMEKDITVIQSPLDALL